MEQYYNKHSDTHPNSPPSHTMSCSLIFVFRDNHIPDGSKHRRYEVDNINILIVPLVCTKIL